jgi:hypothetical protein
MDEVTEIVAPEMVGERRSGIYEVHYRRTFTSSIYIRTL